MATTKPTFENQTSHSLPAPRYNESSIDVLPGKFITGDYYLENDTLDGVSTGIPLFQKLGFTNVSSGSDPDPANIVYDYVVTASGIILIGSGEPTLGSPAVAEVLLPDVGDGTVTFTFTINEISETYNGWDVIIRVPSGVQDAPFRTVVNTGSKLFNIYASTDENGEPIQTIHELRDAINQVSADLTAGLGSVLTVFVPVSSYYLTAGLITDGIFSGGTLPTIDSAPEYPILYEDSDVPSLWCFDPEGGDWFQVGSSGTGPGALTAIDIDNSTVNQVDLTLPLSSYVFLSTVGVNVKTITLPNPGSGVYEITFVLKAKNGGGVFYIKSADGNTTYGTVNAAGQTYTFVSSGGSWYIANQKGTPAN